MYFSTTDTEDLLIVKMRCPLCDHDSKVKLSRQIEFYSIFLIFNFWVPRRKLFGTCGNCLNSFKFNDERADEMYEQLEENGVHIKSYLTRNIGALMVVPLLILLLCAVL